MENNLELKGQEITHFTQTKKAQHCLSCLYKGFLTDGFDHCERGPVCPLQAVGRVVTSQGDLTTTLHGAVHHRRREADVLLLL